MLEELRTVLLPFYLTVKFFHVIFMAVWFMSTAVAYTWFVKSAFLQAQRHPDDAELQRRKDWALKQFDKGVLLEHIAFPLLLLSGIVLYWLSGWPIGWNWLGVKLLIVLLIFVPMELIDYWLSHFGGNKGYLQKLGDRQRYESVVSWHWLFFRITTPLVVIFIPLIIFLAVVKPL